MALTTAKYYTPSGRLIQRDFSGSTFEYFYMNNEMAAPDNTGEREVKETDSGRKVYGGGGITPDVIEPMRELNRFEGLLQSKDVFFLYARRLTSGQVPSAEQFHFSRRKGDTSSPSERTPNPLPNLEITDAILEDFKGFLRDRRIDFGDEDIRNNVDYIKRRIKQEVYTSSFGLQEGFIVAIQGDAQVLKGLELMPEAKLLMSSSRAIPAAQNPVR
jgi:carboxyl-terminal processing protease